MSNGNLFVFKTMTKNSIVSAQSLTSTIPDAMALATMGSNNVESINPTTAGGSKAVAMSLIDNDVEDGILNRIESAYMHESFGNASGMAHMPLDKDGGVLMDITPNYNTTDENSVEDTIKTEILKTAKFTETQFENFKDNKIGSDGTVYGYPSGKMRNNPTFLYLDIMKYLIGYDPQYSTMYNQSPLVPIKIELTIDGISGIFPGNCFQNDYMPKQYNKNTIFQIFTSAQELDASG